MRLFGVLLLPFLSACELFDVLLLPTGDTAVTETTDVIEDSGTEPKTTTEPAEPDLAGGIRLSKVSFYQGVERPVWVELEAPRDVPVPIIAERDALVRVFLEPLASYEPRRLQVNLWLLDGSGKPLVQLDERMRVDTGSTDADVDSTFNFLISGKDLSTDTEIFVEVREINTTAVGGGGKRRTTFESRVDVAGGLPIEPGEDLTFVVFPLRYTADGSNRLPDTSFYTMNQLRRRIEAMYPVRSVEILVAPSTDWGSPIRADGTGFGEVLYALTNTREAAKEDSNVYYYAMFNPAVNFGAFCGYSCTVGLSNLAFSANYPSLRASVGVGYNEYDIAGETFVHEVGHAHGRYHGPCGNPQQVDAYYPYTGSQIGSWGYDQRSQTLLEPTSYVDMMSYCDPIWVSDYTFGALHERIAAVEARPRSIPRLVTRLRIDAEGQVADLDEVTLEGTSGSGLPVTIERLDASGASQGLTHAWMMPYSHLPGGMVMLDERLPAGWSARLVQ